MNFDIWIEDKHSGNCHHDSFEATNEAEFKQGAQAIVDECPFRKYADFDVEFSGEDDAISDEQAQQWISEFTATL